MNYGNLFECMPFVQIWIQGPKTTLEDVEYTIDYSEKSRDLYEKIYKDSKIKIDEEFKQKYRDLFCFKIIKSKDHSLIFIEFKFTEFLKLFNMTHHDYVLMENCNKNYFPFPVNINLKVKRNEKIVKCCLFLEILNEFSLLLSTLKNENYVVLYNSQNHCDFKFNEDLDDKDKKFIEKFQKEPKLTFI